MADDEGKLSKTEKLREKKKGIRGEICPWTAKAYKSCSIDKMANRQVHCYLPAQSGNSAKSSDTQSDCLNTHNKLAKRQGNDKGKQLCLRKLSLCLCHDPEQKMQGSAAATLLTCASAATTASHQWVLACVCVCLCMWEWDRGVCFLSQPPNLFSFITSLCADDGCFADAPARRGLLPAPAMFLCLLVNHKISEIYLDRNCKWKQSHSRGNLEIYLWGQSSIMYARMPNAKW